MWPFARIAGEELLEHVRTCRRSPARARPGSPSPSLMARPPPAPSTRRSATRARSAGTAPTNPPPRCGPAPAPCPPAPRAAARAQVEVAPAPHAEDLVVAERKEARVQLRGPPRVARVRRVERDVLWPLGTDAPSPAHGAHTSGGHRHRAYQTDEATGPPRRAPARGRVGMAASVTRTGERSRPLDQETARRLFSACAGIALGWPPWPS